MSLFPQQDDASGGGLYSSLGNGALLSLIRNRSTTSLASQRRMSFGFGPPHDDDEEAHVPGSAAHRPGSVRFRPVDRDDAGDEPRRTLADERRLSQLILGPQMRSMRLIGNSNPRYQWERYWRTEEELKAMSKPL
jgi:hypothetical protein